MKKLIPIILIVFAPLFSKGQVYQYIPMNLDTTSFWVHDYDYWVTDPFTTVWRHNHLELTTAIVGDSIVNGETYKKYISWVTKVYATELPHLFSGTTGYLRDSFSSAHKIVYGNNTNLSSIYLDFNTQVGDTIFSYPYDPSFWNGDAIYADSIRIENILGTDRRVTYFNIGPGFAVFGTPNKIIEGVGMLYDFPFVVDVTGSLSFQPPGLTCLCYSKNDTVRFLNNYPADSCYKKKKVYPFPNSLRPLAKVLVHTTIQNKRVIFSNIPKEGLGVKLINLNGQELLQTELTENTTVDVSKYASGIYILSLRTNDGLENRKILIR